MDVGAFRKAARRRQDVAHERNDTNLGFVSFRPQERPTWMSVLSVKLEVERDSILLEVGLLLGQELIAELFKSPLLFELLEK